MTVNSLETPQGHNPNSSPRVILRSRSDRESADARVYLERGLVVVVLYFGWDVLPMWHVTAEPRLCQCAICQGLQPKRDRVVLSTLYQSCL
jgi:hypothetical protein